MELKKMTRIEKILASSKASEQFFERFGYKEKVPRFKVEGMNQAELLRLIFSAGFHRGVEFATNYFEKENSYD